MALGIPRGRIGTYLSKVLPSEHRFAIGFPTRHDGSQPWSRFWHAIERAGEAIAAAGAAQIVPCYGLNHPDSPQFKQLARDLSHSTLSGALLVMMSPATVASAGDRRALRRGGRGV